MGSDADSTCSTEIDELYTDDEIDVVRSCAELLLGHACAGGFSAERDAMVITEPFAPFSILYVNEAWCKLCEYSQLEADGNDCSTMLRGPATNRRTVARMMSLCLAGEPCVGAYLVNYKAGGTAFLNEVQIVSDAVKGHDGCPPTFFAAKL
jgi:PAS domain-containing protein|eukprot:4207038-Prymnesium_polylepis.2